MPPKSRHKSNRHSEPQATGREDGLPTSSETPRLAESATITYNSDAPVTEARQDRFDRIAFAKRIAETIIGRIDPGSIVIGIYGPWGDGKTSVLNFVATELSESKSVICLKFNPWRFEDESALLRTFFMSLAELLQKRLSTYKEEIGTVLNKYGGIVSAGLKAAKSALDTMGVSVPTGPAVDITEAATTLGAVWSGASLEELRTRIDTILKAERKRVVILMDDIDRLEKSEIHAVLRLVKLTADFNYTAYILAFDEEMVSAAIGERYGSNPGSTLAAGKKFLEKIVQLPLHLPPIPESALVSFSYECIDEVFAETRLILSQSDGQRFSSQFQASIAPRLSTPRMVKRYANALTFSLILLAGEVNTGDMMLLEAMRLFYPSLYVSLRRNKELILGIGPYASGMHTAQTAKSEIAKLIEGATADLSGDERSATKGLLNALFPRTSPGVVYDQEWEQEWRKQKRIAARDYFDRYFSYAITSADVSDRVVQALIEQLASLTVDKASAMFQRLITPKNAGAVIAKLRQHEASLSPEESRTIMLTVARNAERLPNLEAFAAISRPSAQAAIFIKQLLERISPDEGRLSIGLDVLNQAATLDFGCELLGCLETEEADKALFTDADDERMKIAVADRIAIHLMEASAPVYVTEGRTGFFYLQTLVSCGEGEAARTYITRAIEKRPDSVISFLRTSSPTAYNLETRRAVEAPIRREQYERIASMIDPEVVANALHKQFGETLGRPELDEGGRESISDVQLASQFLALHNTVLLEKAAAGPAK